MSRLLFLIMTAAALASCSNADGPYGYGYAVNERPSLARLGIDTGDALNSFRPLALQEAAAP